MEEMIDWGFWVLFWVLGLGTLDSGAFWVLYSFTIKIKLQFTNGGVPPNGVTVK